MKEVKEAHEHTFAASRPNPDVPNSRRGLFKTAMSDIISVAVQSRTRASAERLDSVRNGRL